MKFRVATSIFLALTVLLSGCYTNTKSSCQAFPFTSNKDLQQEGVTVVALGDKLRVVLWTDQFFHCATASLKDDQYCVLNDVVKLVKKYCNTPVWITGYSDDIGNEDYQDQLSLDRAHSILMYFWSRGISPERMYALGLGSENPIASNCTEMGRALNRRVEITLRRCCPNKEPSHLSRLKRYRCT